MGRSKNSKQNKKSTEVNSSQQTPQISQEIVESEEIRQRSIVETPVPQKSKNAPKPKVPRIIRFMSTLHFILVAVCLFLTIFFAVNFTDIKDNEEKRKEASVQLGKAVASFMLALFFAITKALFLDSDE